jgi:hypothetical protein
MNKLFVALLGLSLLVVSVCAQETNIYSVKTNAVGSERKAVPSSLGQGTSVIVRRVAQDREVKHGAPSTPLTKKENMQAVETQFPGGVFEFDVTLDQTAGSIFLRIFGFTDAGGEPVIPDTSGPTFNFYGSHTAYTDLATWTANRVFLSTGTAINSPALVGVGGATATIPLVWAYADIGGGRWPTDLVTTSLFEFLYVEVVGDYHGVLDLRVEDTGGGGNPTDGDPQFSGLQGQYFQFHGMADEVFSLVSSRDLQMNALFKFITSGSCDYNNTVCWTHPGTYLGQIGMQFGSNKILLQSGSHSNGMKVFLNDREIHPSLNTHRLSNKKSNSSALMAFENQDVFALYSDLMVIRVVNSDYFFNLDFGLKDQQILLAGSRALQITGEICELESRMHKTQTNTKSMIQKKLAETYPAYPLHGLIGQTWRNVVYCGRYYEGSVDDYVVESLFGTEHTFNFYRQ